MSISVFCIGVKFDHDSEFNTRYLEQMKSLFGQNLHTEVSKNTLSGTQTFPAAESAKKASVKQVDLLKQLLQRQKIVPDQFCKDHHVNRLEDLSMQDCRQIILDMKSKADNYF